MIVEGGMLDDRRLAELTSRKRLMDNGKEDERQTKVENLGKVILQMYSMCVCVCVCVCVSVHNRD
jgi:hypothetical protein